LDLIEKISAIESVFQDLDQEIAQLQAWSGLGCKNGCGKCCFKADIEATILEFLPFAQYLYLQNQAFEWLEKIKTSDIAVCTILNPLQAGVGLCSQYKYRGLICRLFGFSARTNKYGQKELVTCQVIKEENSDRYHHAADQIKDGADVPVMNQFYMRLHAIDFELTREFFPINEAIKRALEVILHYHAYRS
jgi:Fe-S-cluster containining protein